jgi:hypothetical protein
MVWLLLMSCATARNGKSGISGPELSAMEIYRLVSPSLAFVQTALSSGSGALIAGGWVLTNAHVVWPASHARLVFPDGTEIRRASVAHVDLIADLALIGPVSIPQPALVFAEDEPASIGNDVYLVGYPMESEQFPQPTIVKGILSRVREWDTERISFLQTDADAAAGQSGGVLADTRGAILGISGWAFTEQGFGMVASAADILPRVRALLEGTDVAGIGIRELPKSAAVSDHEMTLNNLWEAAAFALHAPEGTELEIDVESDADVEVFLCDPFGDEVAYADDVLSGVESIRATTESPSPHFLVVYTMSEEPEHVRVAANVALTPILDADDGREVSLGERVYGGLDYPVDYDFFRIRLDAGERVKVVVESILIDPWVTVDAGVGWETVEDDDGGGGVFGLNAAVIFETRVAGEYLIVVSDATDMDTGGYLMETFSANDSTHAVSFQPIEEEDERKEEEAEAAEAVGTEESTARWLKLFALKPAGWVEDTDYFRETTHADAILFGGGKPAIDGYRPAVMVMSQPIPKGTTLEAIVDYALPEVIDGLGARLRSREHTTLVGRDAELVTMEIDAETSVLVAQFYVVDRQKLWVLQCIDATKSDEMNTGISVLESFRGFDEAPEAPAEPGDNERSWMAMSGVVRSHLREDRHGEAIEGAESLLDFAAAHMGRDHRLFAESLHLLGVAHMSAGDNSEAESVLLDALARYEDLGDAVQLQTARVLNELAWIYYETGRYREGTRFADRAVGILNTRLEPFDSLFLATRHTLAVNLLGEGRLREAARILEDVVAIASREQGEQDQKTIGYLTDYAALLRRMGRSDEAKKLEERAAAAGIDPPEWSISDGLLPAERNPR